MAIGTGEVPSTATTVPVPPIVISGSWSGTGIGGTGSTVTWSDDAVTGATLTSLSAITCPPLSGKCLVTGVGTSGTTGALFLYGAPGGSLTAEFPQVSGAKVTSITQVACPSASTCAAIGTNAGSPVLFSGAIAAPTLPDTWSSNTVPNGSGSVTAVTEVVCPAATTSCLVMASGTLSTGTPAGFLLDATNLGAATTWSSATLPAADNILYFDDIDCTTGASSTCAAVGATPTGAVVLSSAVGGGVNGTWSDQTPTGLSGNTVSGVPIEVNNANLLSGITTTPTTQTYVNAITAGGTNPTQLPLLYPFAGGYNVFAGDCPAESNSAYNVVQAATIPGGISGTTTGMSTPTVPLGLLSIAVANPLSGLPHSGVTLTLKATTSGCTGDTYTLPTTGPDGLSRVDVPYGSYSLYANGSATAYGTLVVGANTVVLSGATLGNGTFALPISVPVVA
jgi:hypothetical protein